MAVSCFLYASIIWDMGLSYNYFKNINPERFITHEANRGFVDLVVSGNIPWFELVLYLSIPFAMYYGLKMIDTLKNDTDYDKLTKIIHRNEIGVYLIIVWAGIIRFIGPLTWYTTMNNELSSFIILFFRPALIVVIGYLLAGWIYIAYKVHQCNKEKKKCLSLL